MHEQRSDGGEFTLLLTIVACALAAGVALLVTLVGLAAWAAQATGPQLALTAALLATTLESAALVLTLALAVTTREPRRGRRPAAD
ncbi:hypothetical protein [Patulibacter defluvii]|uniref:hypothetical protein n=1 Tax=Patulibacter defluvii TaxID=3095358 RepID=UPI002A763943|nr:hypothetical protein [Patulibacter sp. DM4]